MRRLLLFLISLALAAPALPQGLLTPAPCTPTGSSFTESFGDGNAPCWSGGPSTCDKTWVIGAGTPAIVSNVMSAPPQCSHSLQINESAAAQYIYEALPQAIPTGATADVYAQIVFTTAPSANFEDVIALGSGTNGVAGYTVEVYGVNGTPFGLAADGATQSASVNVSTGTAYLMHIHLASGASASYFQIDNGAQEVFTEESEPAVYLVIGSPGAVTTEYTIGAVWVNGPGYTACAQNTYPQALVNFEGGTSGASPSVANLTASTSGGNGTWDVSNSSAQLTFQSAGQIGNFVSQPDVCGAYESGGGSLGLQWATEASGSGYVSYSPALITSQTVSESFLWQTNYPATNTDSADLAEIFGTGASDFVIASEAGTGTSLEIIMENHTGAGLDVAAISPNHLYQITLQYNETGNHKVCVYDGITLAPVGCNTMAAVGAVAPQQFRIGKVGSEPGTVGYDWWYDNVLFDYKTGAIHAF